CVHRTFGKEMVIRYSKIEHVQHRTEVHHPIIREALDVLQINERNIDITSLADIPAGTGLGSSGSFGTALLKALYRYRNKVITPSEVAELACHIEIDRLKEPIGKQDQYVAAHGGINCYEFHPDDRVSVTPLNLSEETLDRLEERILLFSTGIT